MSKTGPVRSKPRFAIVPHWETLGRRVWGSTSQSQDLRDRCPGRRRRAGTESTGVSTGEWRREDEPRPRRGVYEVGPAVAPSDRYRRPPQGLNVRPPTVRRDGVTRGDRDGGVSRGRLRPRSRPVPRTPRRVLEERECHRSRRRSHGASRPGPEPQVGVRQASSE